MTDQTSPSGYRDRNSTADRALTVLNLFTEQRLTLSATDVATELGVARSTGYRYLESLVATHFLEEAPGGGFRLGMRVLELARLARRGFGLAEVARPIMRALAEEHGQTVLLTRRSGASIVCIERDEPADQYVRLSYEVGTLLPLNAGASALVLLAWLPEPELRALLGGRLERFTDRTVTDVEALVERLSTIRRDGYAVTYGEVDPSAIGVAVPLFDDAGHVEAGLSIVALRDRFSGEVDDLVRALLEASKQLGPMMRLLA